MSVQRKRDADLSSAEAVVDRGKPGGELRPKRLSRSFALPSRGLRRREESVDLMGSDPFITAVEGKNVRFWLRLPSVGGLTPLNQHSDEVDGRRLWDEESGVSTIEWNVSRF